MVALIGALYTVERSVRAADPATRQAARAARGRPLLDTIKQWLDTTAIRVRPKGLLGRAIGYALGQWPTLTRLLDDEHLEIDNNTAENCIRPFVTGRKN